MKFDPDKFFFSIVFSAFPPRVLFFLCSIYQHDISGFF